MTKKDKIIVGKPLPVATYLEQEYGGTWKYSLKERIWECDDGRSVFKHRSPNGITYLMKIDGHNKLMPWLSVLMS